MSETTIEALVEGGKATAGPPLGPELGPTGVNIGQVVAEINQKTADMNGMSVPVKVIVNVENKTFKIEVGTPPTSGLLKKEAGIEKGKQGTEENEEKKFVGNISIDSVVKVAKIKRNAVLAKTMKSAVKEIIGTCQTLGITVESLTPKEAIQAIDAGRWADKFRKE